MRLVAKFSDVLGPVVTKLQGFESRGRAEMAMALNAAGEALREKTVEAETRQTGLTHDTIERAQVARGASATSLTFTTTAKGGNVRLKFFGAKEGGGGVSAHPWNRPSFYAGAFITSGRPGRRAPSPKLHGQVYTNIAGGKWRGKISQVRSGLYIPTEMTRGETASTFEAGARAALEAISARIMTELV